jgi:hypothetical protein
MLIDEGQDANGDDGSLILLSGIPRAWLADGKEIRVVRAPTHYGPLSLHVVSRIRAGRIEADLAIEPREPIRRIVIKLFHPERRPLRSAVIRGREVRLADAETIVFSPGGERSFQLTAEY